MRDGASAEAFSYDRYDEIRGMQQRAQPNTDNIMLRGVDSAPVLPEAPPSRSADHRKPTPSPLRGAMRPTSDPASGQELP
jgi:general secretion pathway protein D